MSTLKSNCLNRREVTDRNMWLVIISTFLMLVVNCFVVTSPIDTSGYEYNISTGMVEKVQEKESLELETIKYVSIKAQK